MKIFLSYNWENSKEADEICEYLKKYQDIEVFRDKIKLKPWESIQEFMNSIREMDYTIIMISDKYLKSENCMYEVLQVIKQDEYRKKIFPIVIDKDIYNPDNHLEYIIYWEKKTEEYKKKLETISIENSGNVQERLKRYRDNAFNIERFLETICDMNNPEIDQFTVSVENKLKERGLLVNELDNQLTFKLDEDGKLMPVSRMIKNKLRKLSFDNDTDIKVIIEDQRINQFQNTIQDLDNQAQMRDLTEVEEVKYINIRNKLRKLKIQHDYKEKAIEFFLKDKHFQSFFFMDNPNALLEFIQRIIEIDYFKFGYLPGNPSYTGLDIYLRNTYFKVYVESERLDAYIKDMSIKYNLYVLDLNHDLIKEIAVWYYLFLAQTLKNNKKLLDNKKVMNLFNYYVGLS